MATLFLAPTAREARSAAWQLLKSKSQADANPLAALLDPPLVFCDGAAASDWRHLARQSASGSSHTTSAPRLIRAEAFFARFYGSLSRRRALSGADRLWVLHDAARLALARHRGGELEGDLERLVSHRATLQGAARHIADLRRAGLPTFPTAPGADALQALLQCYDARRESLGAFDFEAAPALFPPAAERDLAFQWPRALLLDDLAALSPALQIGLDALIHRAEIVVATLFCGGDAPDAALENALQFWKSRGAEIVRVGDWKARGAQVAARILGGENEAAPPQNLFLTRAHAPRDEMERVAAHIRAEVEAGARPDDFALGIADFAAYEADARAAFSDFGVPLDWPLQAPLERSPLVRALLRALDSRAAQLNVHALHDLFGDGTLALAREGQSLDARRLRAAGLAARHPDLDDLVAARAALERKLAQLERQPRRDEAASRASLERALAAGDLEMVAAFQALLAPLEGRSTASFWRARVMEVVAALTAHWQNGETPACARARHDLARFQLAVEAVAERARGWDDAEIETARGAGEWLGWLAFEVETGAASNGAPPETQALPETQAPDKQGESRLESQTTASDCARALDNGTLVARASFAANQSGLTGGVRVGGIGAGLQGARATFWCGLSEGVWPRADSPHAATRELDALLNAHQAAPIARATHDLARAAGENRALFLSHAHYLNGEETPASPLLDDLNAAFPGTRWPQLPSPDPQQMVTRKQVLQAWNGWIEAGNAPVSEGAAALDAAKQLGTLACIRAARRESEIGIYDGALGERGRELMLLCDGDGAALSGSGLEFYARCPLRYFFEKVLRLRHSEREEDDINPREAGTLVHEIARDWVGRSAQVLQNGDFAGALQLLGDIARAKCENLSLRPILREAEWRRLLGFDGQSGPLVAWIRFELAASKGAWSAPMQPLAHRAAPLAGIENGLEHRFDFEIGGYPVTGSIDRIDASASGDHLAILDYKTGASSSIPAWSAGDNGLRFQLAIYALALRQIAFDGAPPRLSMGYLWLREAKIGHAIGQESTLGKGSSSPKVLGETEFAAWLDDVSARVARIGDLRRAGVFNLSLQSPKDAKCPSCASKSLCRQHQPTQELRFETHQGSPFVYLPLLREWSAEV